VENIWLRRATENVEVRENLGTKPSAETRTYLKKEKSKKKRKARREKNSRNWPEMRDHRFAKQVQKTRWGIRKGREKRGHLGLPQEH